MTPTMWRATARTSTSMVISMVAPCREHIDHNEYNNDAGDSGLSAPGNDEFNASGTTVFALYLAGATPGHLAKAAGAKDQQSVRKFSSQHNRPRSDYWL